MARSSRRRPRRTIVVAVAAALLLAAGSFGVPVDLAFTSLWDSDDPLVTRYEQVYSELRLSGRLVLLLTGPEDGLDDAAAALTGPLQAHPAVTAVIAGQPHEWLEEQSPWLVDDRLFDDWIGVAVGANDAPYPQALQKRLDEARDQSLPSNPEGVRLVEVHLDEDPLSAPMGRSSFFEIEALTLGVLEPLGVRGEYAGFPAVAAQDQMRTNRNVLVMSPLGLLLVLLVLRFVEPRPLHVAVVALPLVLSVLAALGIVGQLVGELTMVVAFFGVMVFGLGVDFALHLMIRLREERSDGVPLPDALDRTFESTGPPILIGGGTTAGAFFLLLLADDPAARHLGLAGGVGLVLCIALMFVLLPACWTLLEGVGSKTARIRAAVDLQLAGVQSLASWSATHPRACLSGGVAVLLVAAAGIPSLHYETDLRRVFNRDVPALEAAEQLQSLYDRNAGPWIAAVPTVERLREVTALFEADPFFPEVVSAAPLFPVDAPQRAARLKEATEAMSRQLQTLSTARLFAPAKRVALDQLRDLIELLQRAGASGPPTPESLPPGLAKSLRAPDGSWLVLAYAARPTTDGRRAREERLAAWRNDPGAVGVGLAIEATMAAERTWIIEVVLAILGLVLTVLAIDLRSVRRVILALIPVLFGTVVTAGFLSLAGVGFTPLTIVVVPLILGLGVDDGVHVVHRMAEPGANSAAVAAGSVGRAILMTTLTSCAGFSALLFSNHPGMEGVAVVLLVGLPVCLLASIMLLPAVATVWGPSDAENGRSSDATK